MTLARLLGSALLFAAVTAAWAQTPQQRAACERNYSPQSGQEGKDVVWVPTPDFLVDAMLKEAKVTSSDLVFDLGAGDGKIAIAAARDFGARAVGVEYNPSMVKLANCLLNAAGVADKVKVIEGDIFKTDFSAATVVTLYLLPTLNERLRPTLLKMKPGTRIVSNSFLMGDWEPDQSIRMDGVTQAYFWLVPANVDGTWTLTADGRDPIRLWLRQNFQVIDGNVLEGSRAIPIESATLRGNEIAFVYAGANGRTAFTGTVDQDKMTLAAGPQATAYVGRRGESR